MDDIELFAWLGEDEFGSGQIGLKQGVVPSGIIPIVAIDREKIEKIWHQAEAQAAAYGKRIYLVRFQMVEILRSTEKGTDAPCR